MVATGRRATYRSVVRLTSRLLTAALLAAPLLVGVPGSATALTPPAATADPAAGPAAGRAAGPAAERAGMRRVVAISVDGLNPAAIARVGRPGSPNLHRLLDEGAGTLNARSAVEMTVTLPNHTGMLTSRRIATPAGHGMDVNEDPGGTVAQHAGHPVGSVFSRLRASGARGALYVSKSKLDILHRSWAGSIARYVVDDSTSGLMGAVRRDLVARPRPFSFVHLGLPDQVGHESGWMSEPYLDAVRHVDRAVGDLLRTLDEHPAVARRTTLVLTADHGGAGSGHQDPTKYANYRVPFLTWGAGVERGADLYRLNPQLRNPRGSRPSYDQKQPVRNAAVGNLALDLLGIGPIAGSGVNAGQRLRLR